MNKKNFFKTMSVGCKLMTNAQKISFSGIFLGILGLSAFIIFPDEILVKNPVFYLWGIYMVIPIIVTVIGVIGLFRESRKKKKVWEA